MTRFIPSRDNRELLFPSGSSNNTNLSCFVFVLLLIHWLLLLLLLFWEITQLFYRKFTVQKKRMAGLLKCNKGKVVRASQWFGKNKSLLSERERCSCSKIPYYYDIFRVSDLFWWFCFLLHWNVTFLDDFLFSGKKTKNVFCSK